MAQSAPSTPTGTHDSTFNQTQWEAIQAAIDAKLPNFKTALSTLKSQKPDTYTPGRRSDLNLWLFGVENILNSKKSQKHSMLAMLPHFSVAQQCLFGVTPQS